jgi:hypothetical protein
MSKIIDIYMEAVDPGCHGFATAFFKNGVLIAVNYRTLDGSLDEKIKALPEFITAEGYDLVCERPITYSGRSARGDTNDLLDLSILIGAYAAKSQWKSIKFVKPYEWKGSLRKATTKRLCLQELSNEEKDILQRGLNEAPRKRELDLMDSVGIGLAQLGRLFRNSLRLRGTIEERDD